MTILDRILEAQEFLGKSHDSARSTEEKELLGLAIDALWFIWQDGLSDQFEDYRKDVQSDAPARVVAAFDNREDADAWLKASPKPPGSAYILIADEYHLVVYFRDRNARALIPHPTLGFYLKEMMRDGLPQAAATFNTREEADAWFEGQSEPPAQTIIQIGGEHYLAVYYRNINHRAIFPFSIAKRLDEKEEPGE